eukprot:2633271-Amphidinium_carterae.1
MMYAPRTWGCRSNFVLLHTHTHSLPFWRFVVVYSRDSAENAITSAKLQCTITGGIKSIHGSVFWMAPEVMETKALPDMGVIKAKVGAHGRSLDESNSR